jgi:N utilization substance protein B
MSKRPLTDQQILVAKRRKARHYAMQALYQWKMTKAPINSIETEFHVDNDFRQVDVDYFNAILHEVPANLDVIDEAIEHCITDREIKDINPVEFSLLRMAVYELKERIDTPYKVVINEAVSLAKKFGAEDSHKFVNAVLDKAAKDFRAIEVQANKR